MLPVAEPAPAKHVLSACPAGSRRGRESGIHPPSADTAPAEAGVPDMVRLDPLGRAVEFE